MPLRDYAATETPPAGSILSACGPAQYRTAGRFAPGLGCACQEGIAPTNGLPLTESFPDGGLTIQYFERARLEYHPDYAPGQQIAIGQIGRELSGDRANDPPFRPLVRPTGGGAYFAQTGHTLHGGFAD